MPNGRLRFDAKPSDVEGVAAPSAALKTRTRPAPLSATKMSPLGATRTTRGLLRPSANKSTAKPGGTLGAAPAGRATTCEGFAAGGGASGAGLYARGQF